MTQTFVQATAKPIGAAGQKGKKIKIKIRIKIRIRVKMRTEKTTWGARGSGTRIRRQNKKKSKREAPAALFGTKGSAETKTLRATIKK